MIRTVMLIPLRDNTGRPFRKAIWKELEARLLQFGGLSLLPEISGIWQAGGQTYRERSNQYVVSLSTWFQLPQWLDTVLWAIAAFRQEALYIEVAGIPEIVRLEEAAPKH